MNFETIRIIALLGSWLTLTLMVWFLFPHVSPEKTNKPTLHRFEPKRSLTHATETFSRCFNKTLGPTHFSWYCLLSSINLSLIAGTSIALLRISIYPTDIHYINFSEYVDYLETFFVFFMTMLVFNFLPSFLSLLKTRFILQKIKNNPISYKHWFLFDFEITFALAILPWLLGVFIEAFFRSKYLRFDKLSDYFFNSLLPLDSPLAIAFYATFFSWAWLWLFIFSNRIIPLIKTFTVKNKILEKEQKVVLSIRLVSIIIITLLYLIALLIIG